MIWEAVESLAETYKQKFLHAGAAKADTDPNYHVNTEFVWENYLFEHQNFRRGHIEILDARKLKRIWVMHVTIFPHLDCADPVFGFDVVAGENKITGAFHDFSRMGKSDLYDWFQFRMAKLQWGKPRELPAWGKAIFSPAAVAAGNIRERAELDQLMSVAIDNLDQYLYTVGKHAEDGNYTEQFNYYCAMQKMNPHTPAMMESLGVDKDLFRKFMDDVLFPEHNG
jgi:phycocyanobilin:ferredoxin oxidoreductase